jgi:hypothetical protein
MKNHLMKIRKMKVKINLQHERNNKLLKFNLMQVMLLNYQPEIKKTIIYL